MPDDLADARDQGRAELLRFYEGAPADPRLRLAWTKGADRVDLLRLAVGEARQAGLPWRVIAEALGEVESTTRVRYTQPGRWRRYKERRDAKDD